MTSRVVLGRTRTHLEHCDVAGGDDVGWPRLLERPLPRRRDDALQQLPRRFPVGGVAVVPVGLVPNRGFFCAEKNPGGEHRSGFTSLSSASFLFFSDTNGVPPLGSLFTATFSALSARMRFIMSYTIGSIPGNHK